MQANISHRALVESLGPSRPGLAAALYAAFAAIVGSLLIAVSAKVQVPFWPVPMTMQTFAVVALAMLYGPRLGVLTGVVYVLEGLLGLPVFAGSPARGVGFAYLIGPTGGYIAGFVLAMWGVGSLAKRGWDRSFGLAILAAAIGMVLIYVPGVLWLSTHVGLEKAIAVGAVPFLLADLSKLLLAGLLIPAIRRLA